MSDVRPSRILQPLLDIVCFVASAMSPRARLVWPAQLPGYGPSGHAHATCRTTERYASDAWTKRQLGWTPERMEAFGSAPELASQAMVTRRAAVL